MYDIYIIFMYKIFYTQCYFVYRAPLQSLPSSRFTEPFIYSTFVCSPSAVAAGDRETIYPYEEVGWGGIKLRGGE